MNTVFADSYLWLAVVNTRDAGHARALQFLEGFDGRMVTTEAVLLEVADALAVSPAGRAEFATLEADLRADASVEIVSFTSALFHRAVVLYCEIGRAHV